MAAPLLRVRDLRVTFTTPRGTVRAVDSVGFTVEAGRTLASSASPARESPSPRSP